MLNRNNEQRTNSGENAEGSSSSASSRVAFKMKLLPGHAEEYKSRHDQLWPELQQLLKNAGISEYSIFLDEETNSLFAVLTIVDSTQLDQLPANDIMQRWWKFMSDIMETNPNDSPVSIPLKEVFYLR